MIQIFFMVSLALGMSACSSLPKNPHKPTVMSYSPSETGCLADAHKAVMKSCAKDESAFMLITKNSDALRWRLALIDEARKSIDLQVFIWSDDESGRLMVSRILAAAKRGVRVRLLIDDMPKDWPDRFTSLISYQENISIHRFNPGRIRKGIIFRSLQMLVQFRSLNRRMHNKQLIVDGTWAVVGGRNIGNPYFGLSRKYNNRDLDMLLTGPLTDDLAQDFDEYWNADASYPGRYMNKPLSARQTEKTLRHFYKKVKKDRKLLEKTAIPTHRTNWESELESLTVRMVQGKARSLKDDPIVKGNRGTRLIDLLGGMNIRATETSVITPYMIPSKGILAAMEQTIKNGRKIRIIVPAMESNNHTMAHSYYKKYRKRLVQMGIELYEFSGSPSDELRENSDTYPVESDFISLHTKAFVFDKKLVLLGSLNLDPRSIRINTEHMIVIDSPPLAKMLLSYFDTMISEENAWKVYLNEDSKLRWKKGDKVVKRQPARSMWQRFLSSFYRLMPIESQL